jgi:outer membrane immunogenic protein
MRLSHRLGYIIALAVGAVTPSAAADLAVGVVPGSAGFSWTGCHLGGHLGGGVVSGGFTGQFLDTAIPSTFGAPTTISINNSPAKADGLGVVGGGQVGCDLQLGPKWVIGFDADASGANFSDSPQPTLNTTLFGPVIPAPTTVATTGTLADNANFIATGTGRIGYAYVPWGLFYAKAGAAWVRSTYSYTGQDVTTSCAAFYPNPPCTTFNPTVTRPFNYGASDTRIGWTVGFGVEWAVSNNWSVKLEYDYLDFGSRNLTFTDPANGSVNIGVSQQINEIKAGVNYLFGG